MQTPSLGRLTIKWAQYLSGFKQPVDVCPKPTGLYKLQV